MSTDTRTWAITSAIIAVGATALIVAFVVAGQTDTAAGVAVGVTVMLILGAVARRRARRSPDSATSLDRLAAGSADERDRKILLIAGAATGGAAVLLSVVAMVVTALDGGAQSIITAQPTALLGVFAVSVLLADRKV